MIKLLVFVPLWGLFGLLGCGRDAGPSGVRKRPDAAAEAPTSSAAPSTDGEVEPPEPQAGLTRTTAQQLRAAIQRSKKKATLVSAWASWCGPCRRELPMLQALAVNLKPQGVRVVLVTVDDPKDEAKALSFLKDNGITLQSYRVDGSINDFKIGINPRWPGMLPASFLFDAQAELVHFWGGEAFENEIVPVVENFLAGRAIEPETRYGLAPGKVE
jgi:thiol-disulfide isomerase/thioredoxin